VGAGAARGRAPLTRPVGARQSLGLAVVGVVGGSAPFVLFFEGLSQASSTDAALLQKTLVLWVVLLAVPLLHERLGWSQAAAVGLLLVGQALASGSVTLPQSVPAKVPRTMTS
jgi:drug/metabolite transporter (DMT)-like permease